LLYHLAWNNSDSSHWRTDTKSTWRSFKFCKKKDGTINIWSPILLTHWTLLGSVLEKYVELLGLHANCGTADAEEDTDLLSSWATEICVASLAGCLCGLVIRVPGYRSRGPMFDSWLCHIFWEEVGLEWGPLSLVSITEELLEWKCSGSSLENRD
jgi:hypothetical protein